jgi:hypothetical protein
MERISFVTDVRTFSTIFTPMPLVAEFDPILALKQEYELD